MKTKKLKKLSLLLVTLFLACGPMNEKPKDTPNKLNDFSGAVVTQNKLFYFYASNTSAATPQVGDNSYLFRLVSTKDLQPLTSQSKIAITYWMPDMPDMGKTDIVASQQEDKSYKATLFFSTSGRWEITVKVQDTNVEDAYVFEVNP